MTGFKELAFIHDEDFRVGPTLQRRLARPDTGDKFIHLMHVGSDGTPGVNGHAYGTGQLGAFADHWANDFPPICDAAMPVLAVTETTAGLLEYLFRRAVIIF